MNEQRGKRGRSSWLGKDDGRDGQRRGALTPCVFNLRQENTTVIRTNEKKNKRGGYLTLVSSCMCTNRWSAPKKACVRSDDTTLCLLSCHVIRGGPCGLWVPQKVIQTGLRVVVGRRCVYCGGGRGGSGGQSTSHANSSAATLLTIVHFRRL